jgi:hypothetical protein
MNNKNLANQNNTRTSIGGAAEYIKNVGALNNKPKTIKNTEIIIPNNIPIVSGMNNSISLNKYFEEVE